jgi:hypothetical protein
MDVRGGLFHLDEESDEAVGGKFPWVPYHLKHSLMICNCILGYGDGRLVGTTAHGGCATHGTDAWTESAEQYSDAGVF